jgi:SpoVK/Ycf46/Vps4 family AAA+-type ATPase
VDTYIIIFNANYLVDLPNEAQREAILKVHMADENLDSSVSFADLAKETKLYSGSDLKNLCISAALAAVKETVVRSNDLDDSNASTEQILKKVDSLVEDWSAVISESNDSKTKSGATAGPQKRIINKTHFEWAMKEVPPSLTDETTTLVELRKWDEMYGDGAARRKGVKKGWGFETKSTSPKPSRQTLLN